MAQVSVLLPLPLAGTYDYSVPSELTVDVGDFVRVPLGRRSIIGVVWGEASTPLDATRLKDIEEVLDAPPLPEIVRRFVDWVADYTVHPPGTVLKMTMSIPEALRPPRTARGYVLAEDAEMIRLTAARRRVLAVLADSPPRTRAELAQEAGVTPGVIDGLVEAAALTAVPLAEPSQEVPELARAPVLSEDQACAATHLCAAVNNGFSATLLDGVPGSGKTEVYFEAVGQALQAGRQVLVMLPEIALGAQWLRRFTERFGCEPGVWHSDVRRAEKQRTWRAVADGRQRVVVGARSALFLPFPNLGLIVVDEEHDPSYKQDDGVFYHARDMAIVRARIGDCAIVLASATPSLESLINARGGRYSRVHLPQRHAGAEMPRIELVDLRAERPPTGAWLSPRLRAALDATVAAGRQAMLFLNRRGYAPLTLCRNCGYRFNCPSCSAWLVEHRATGRLSCHHCGYATRLPNACPACGAENALAACGPGVERLAEEVTAILPQARVAIAASDTLPGPKAVADLVDRIQAGTVDIVIGTQVVAKGHHFPGLTTVGVVDADLGLSGGDLRAGERTFQLLYQVAGRAGRAEHPGTVFIQTCQPEHILMQALKAGDRDAFYAAEEAARAGAAMPPFGRLAAVIVSGPDERAVDLAARAIAAAAPYREGMRILGPTPAPLAMLRGRHRRRFLMHGETRGRLSEIVRAWLAPIKTSSGVRVQIDIDPLSFL